MQILSAKESEDADEDSLSDSNNLHVIVKLAYNSHVYEMLIMLDYYLVAAWLCHEVYLQNRSQHKKDRESYRED